MHLHSGFGPVWALKLSPRVSLSTCSTRGVQEPQEAEALVTARTSSRLESPWATIAAVIAPLHTPLQPHTSAVSAMAATAALGSRPDRPSVTAWPKIRVSRIPATSWPERIRSKYQPPSAASPNRTAPAILPSCSTTRL